MKRRIAWGTCALDEIELVYEKAEENTAIADQLEQLELQALNEAKANIGMFPSDDHKILLPEQFDALSDNDKEILIMLTGNKGLSGLQTDMETATIKIRLSSLIPRECDQSCVSNIRQVLTRESRMVSPNLCPRPLSRYGHGVDFMPAFFSFFITYHSSLLSMILS